MKKMTEKLDGAWEERGVIGTRIEIDGKRITVLWRGGPVLETTFKIVVSESGFELRLKKNGLRYAGAYSDYAEVKSVTYADGKLTFTEYFPITGESKTTLSRTDRTRYGDYDIDQSVLPELQGVWKSDPFEIEFKNDEAVLDGDKRRIVVLRPRNGYGSEGRYIIADSDPSVDEWHGFSRFEYEGGVIRTRMLVCDAPSVEFVFRKSNAGE